MLVSRRVTTLADMQAIKIYEKTFPKALMLQKSREHIDLVVNLPLFAMNFKHIKIRSVIKKPDL